MLSRENPVIQGIAKAFWCSSYADEVEEQEREWSSLPPQPGPRQDWMDYIPDVPDRAYEYAFYLLGKFEVVNKDSIYGILSKVFKAAELPQESEHLEKFGHYMAMRAMCHGVAWEDDHPNVGLQYPYVSPDDLRDLVVESLEQNHGIVDKAVV